jgi:LysM repeat protein
MRRIITVGMVVVLALVLAAPVLAADATIHVVQPGENLYRIALRYGVTVNAIAQANGLTNTRRIYVGQRLVIPTGGPSSPPASSGSVHVVQRGENLYRIALRYGTTVQALAAANGIVNTGRIYAGQRLVIPGHSGPPPSTPPASGQTYVVRRGDTLSAIALRYGVSVWSIAQLNGIGNPSLIYVGQVLRIPAGGSPSPPAPSPPSPAPNSGRWIDVDLSAQRLTAYVGSTAVRSTLVSTGLPRTPTPTGQFRIYVKYRATPMSGPGYYLPDVPYTMYFYKGYGIHGTYWHSNFGHPMSHGCINLPTPEAQWLYNWASVGTLVNIHY